MADFAVFLLVLMWLISIPLYFTCDHAIERFRRNPDPARVSDLRQYAVMMNIAAAVYIGSVILVMFIIDPSGLRSDDDGFFRHKISGPLFLFFILAAALRWIFGARRRPIDPSKLPPYAAVLLPSFFARSDIVREEPDLDRNYKIFAAPTMLCGACVKEARDQTSKYSDVISQYSVQDAMFYDAFDVTWPQFLQLNKKNFQVPWNEVASIECDPVPKGEDVVDAPNSGSIVLRLKSGAARELVVLAQLKPTVLRDVKALRDELQQIADKANAVAPVGQPPVHNIVHTPVSWGWKPKMPGESG